MVRARIIRNAGSPGKVECMNIRKNITNPCAKIKNIVVLLRRQPKEGNFSGRKHFNATETQSEMDGERRRIDY